MAKIRIKRNTNGDTRTADHIPTIKEFGESNNLHCKDVLNIMHFMADNLRDAGEKHDWTKTTEPYKSMFYKDFINTMEEEMEFTDGEWYEQHCGVNERHHLDVYVPEDVNLVDVIEMMCDFVAAGLARTGEVGTFTLDANTLSAAIANTLTMIENKCEVIGDDDSE